MSIIRNFDLDTPIGILDPYGFAKNPLTGKQYSIDYIKNAVYDPDSGKFGWSYLPMYQKTDIPSFMRMLKDNQVVLVVSGTGSGKTVLTPKYLLHVMKYNGYIAITNPKRAPSSENAKWAATTLDVDLGVHVGLKFRGSDPEHYSKQKSKLIYCSDGWILEKLKNDPYLNGFDAIIIDEAHERNIRIDMLLLLTKRLLLKRPKFKLIIMSATIDEKIFIDYYPLSKYKFKYVEVSGKPNFPVKPYYLDSPVNKFRRGILDTGGKDPPAHIIAAVDRITKIIKDKPTGDILCFVNSYTEGEKAAVLLREKIGDTAFVSILTAATKEADKNLAIHSSKYKELGYSIKVVFATNVAESSLTVDGLVYVIDTGLSFVTRYYPKTNINALETRYISQHSHLQRLGRAGRTKPGFCYNIFTEKEYNKQFPKSTDSPVKTENSDELVLLFMTDEEVVSHIDLPFEYIPRDNSDVYPKSLQSFMNEMIEKPDLIYTLTSIYKLKELGALSEDGNKMHITQIGREMRKFSQFGNEMARSIVEGEELDVKEYVYLIALAVNTYNSPKDTIFNNKLGYERILKTNNDFISILRILAKFMSLDTFPKKIDWCSKYGFSAKMLNMVANQFYDDIGPFKFEYNQYIEENVIKCIKLGLSNNLLRKEGGKYETINQKTKIKAKIDKTFYKSNGKYLHYYSAININGSKKFMWLMDM